MSDTNPIKQGQLLKKYREIEGDIVGLLDSFSPGDSSALILDKISHLKQTLHDLQQEYEPGTLEHTSIANQYGQTLRAAMDKGVDIIPEREIMAGVDFEPEAGPDPLSETEYTVAEQQQRQEEQRRMAASTTDLSIDPLYASLNIIDFGMRRSKNGPSGVRKIHFNHRPPTVFDDVWYGHNEAAMDALVGPMAADEMMVMTHLALNDSVEKPNQSQREPSEGVTKIPHTEQESLENNLASIVNNQQKRVNTSTPQQSASPLDQLSRF